MKLAALVIAGTIACPLAHATTFEEYASGVGARPAAQLYEASCDLDVELRGAVASVELKQRIVNPGPQPMAAVYEHELPDSAVVTGFAIRSSGKVEKALAVPASFRTAETDSPDVLGADPAVLRKVGAGRYEIVVQPIPADDEVVLITRYTVLATPRAGALRVVMPGRMSAGKLALCKGSVRVTPGPGVTVKRIRAAGIENGTRTAAVFSVDTANVALDVDLEVAGKDPVLWTQSQALADGWSASLVTVLAPRVKATGARRVVFVIDGSRSMELVGRHNVGKVVKALGSALPANAEVEAIVYDRTATRVFGELRPATAQNLALVEAAIAKRGASNGSDLVGAFELAKQVIAGGGARGQAMVIVVTDGVTAELPDDALIKALASKTSAVDVHAIVLDPARTRSPGGKALRAPVNLYGGAYVEVNVDELDDAMIAIDEWMRPSWLELALVSGHAIPAEVRGGAGFTKLVLHKGAAHWTLRGHSEAPFTAAARPAPTAALAALALANATAADFAGPDVDEQLGAPTLAKAVAAHVSAEHDRAFVVLATTGRIAKDRRAMIVGGGRYERMIALPDPQRATNLPASPAPIPATAIARITLERLFRDQLHPKAFACYQRALGVNAALAGTVHFQLRMGRGEVTHVQLTGIGDASLDACLVDAAYGLTPPMPDFSVNADDQTIANYPLTFNRRADQAVVVLGDADSTSPIDIDAVVGGVPGRRTMKVNTKTPLGNIRPSKSP